MKILFFCSTWGLEKMPSLEAQLRAIKAGGFDGVEMAVPPDAAACRETRKILDNLGLAVIAQQCRTIGQTVAEHTADFAAIFERALLLRPLHLNSHTGRDQGPQIPDPRDAMWQAHLDVHLAWWKKIVALRRAETRAVLCVTPEFGPAPYMTLLPHTHQPIADLWDINVFMRDWLKEQLPA